MVASTNGAMAQARAILDRALASPRGIALDYLDADYGGPANAEREVRRMTNRFYQARAHMRRVQIRMAQPDDLLRGLTDVAIDPDAARTAYDKLYFDVDRNVEGNGWVLAIRDADVEADALKIREL